MRACFRHLPGIKRKRIAPTPPEDMRLHRLERPEPWQGELWQKMQQLPPVNWYPDYGAFHRRIADFAGVDPENAVIGAGIEDFIRSLIILCCDPGDGFAYTWPTCAMFDVYAEVFSARPVRIETTYDTTADDIIARLDDGVRLLILPNPGQPVETNFGLSDMRRIARRCADIGAVLAVDEAYYGFGAQTSLPLVDVFPNAVVLRTFSKAFGGAGLRVGCAIGRGDVIRSLDAIRESGEVAGPSMHIATVLMDEWPLVEQGIADVCAGRDWLRDRLLADGYEAHGSVANHVNVRIPDGAGLVERLRVMGAHVRLNQDGSVMITCGSVALMQRFYEAFRAA